MTDLPPVRGIFRPALLPVWLKLQKSAIWQRALAHAKEWRPPREFHAFGVGLPRTGTLSLANLLSSNYRSEHEPETWILTHLFKQSTLGYGQNLSKDQRIDILKARDNLLNLSFESNHVLGLVIDSLYDAFEDAKYILTVRDCYSWLNSTINRRQYTGYRQPWALLADYRYGARRNYSEEEAQLEEMGLYPVGKYFSYWSDHIHSVLTTIPSDNLLVIRTRDLSQRTHAIADFLDIPHDSLNHEKKHSHRRREKSLNIYDLVDRDYIEEQAEFHCGDLMDKFYDGV